MSTFLPDEHIINKIIMVRWQKVMLDRDLADFYDVETKYLKRQVRRNSERFPEDFMFEITKDEFQSLRSHFGTSRNSNTWWTRYMPFAFTEHGVLMLSAVLRSEKAVQTSVAIVRVFNRMRQLLQDNQTLMEKLHTIEQKLADHDDQFAEARFQIKQILRYEKQNKDNDRKIGFRID